MNIFNLFLIFKPKFLNEEQIVQDFIKTMNSGVKTRFLSMPKDHLIYLHMTLGLNIRNKYKLWDKNNPNTGYSKDLDKYLSHPKDFSLQVMETAWEELN